MRDTKEYNGWTNRATWVFNLYFEETLLSLAHIAVKDGLVKITTLIDYQDWARNLVYEVSKIYKDFNEDEVNESIRTALNHTMHTSIDRMGRSITHEHELLCYVMDMIEDHNVDWHSLAKHHLETVLAEYNPKLQETVVTLAGLKT
jgi:hypothetical protein